MRKVIVVNNLTLDGVMQAPGRKDEDMRGGFPYGGWAAPYNDDVKMQEMGAGMSQESDFLFGRWTYELMYESWHGRTDNPFSPILESRQKYVASNTLKKPLRWQNSTLLTGDATNAVQKLKKEEGKDLVVMGSGELVRSLAGADLVDRYVLLIHPLVLGVGHHLFDDDGTMAKLRLVRCVPTTRGVIIATYEPAA